MLKTLMLITFLTAPFVNANEYYGVRPSNVDTSRNSVGLSKQVKDNLISERIEKKTGMVVADVSYSLPEGIVGVIAKTSTGLAKLAGKNISVDEVHITTNTGIVLNCNVQFDDEKVEITVLSQCTIFDKSLTTNREALIGASKL